MASIIYEYRDFPAPNNQLRLRVRLTTAPTANFLGNGNDIITLNNVTEEFERGYRTDAIDPLDTQSLRTMLPLESGNQSLRMVLTSTRKQSKILLETP